jgi:S1-C subfamily serine protease
VVAKLVEGSASRAVLAAVVTIIISFGMMMFGEWLGLRLKLVIMGGKILNRVDNTGGSVLSLITFSVALWFGVALVALLPNGPIQHSIRASTTFGYIDRHLPPASQLLSNINQFIDPNNTPLVFSGREPSSSATLSLQPISSFNSVIDKVSEATVRIQGIGCGGIVNGTGFVYGPGKIATNAHVIAGVKNPKVYDANGTHDAKVVMFDSTNDVAVLSAKGVSATPLALDTEQLQTGETALVVGYPGGGSQKAQTVGIIDTVIALGRDIYGRAKTERHVYVMQSQLIPGNSGGPVVDTEGNVRGIVFATSTTYSNVGYALTLSQVAIELEAAAQASSAVGTGSCSTM